MNGGWIALVNERDAPSVAEQAAVSAISWRLVQSAAGTLHLSLYLGDGVARVTSAVRVIDPIARAVITTSGRMHHLASPPEQDAFLLGLIHANAARGGVLGKDVSDEVWSWCC